MPAELELLEFRQNDRVAVCLNEDLVFHFSSPLDRASVTHESVRILDPRGDEVPGTFEVRRSTLKFRPRYPRSPALDDGSFLPGRTYRVELLGFPRPDGLRGRGGSVLRYTRRLGFTVAARGSDDPLFLDPLPDRPHPLVPRALRIGPLDPIRLECGEGLDPTSLDATDFELRFLVDRDARRAERGRLERIPLRAELEENRRDEALLALRPLDTDGSLGGLRALSPGEYYLHAAAATMHLATLGGRRVQPGWGPTPLLIRVVQPGKGLWVEEFDGTASRGSEEVAGADGTAAWDGSGAVRVRYPAAAGDGRHGRVTDLGRELPCDVQASEIELASDGRWDLSERRGLVVLRAQAGLTLDGTLVRRSREGTPAIEDSFRAEDRRLLADAGPLDEWLEAARAAGHDWTVFIAGGELRVPGVVTIEGPLLLVAGGWIRIAGRLEASEAWKCAQGGENIVSERAVRAAPLRISEPTANPLVVPLRLAVLSTPIRPEGGVLRWGGTRVTGYDGAGSYRVRFFGLRDLGESEFVHFGPLDDLALLEDCAAVRFLVELEVPPGGTWDPPRVERVELSWTEPSHRETLPGENRR